LPTTTAPKQRYGETESVSLVLPPIRRELLVPAPPGSGTSVRKRIQEEMGYGKDWLMSDLGGNLCNENQGSEY